MKYLFASKADFQVWVHQVLLISIPSKDLFYRLNKGIIHWRSTKKVKIEVFNGTWPILATVM